MKRTALGRHELTVGAAAPCRNRDGLPRIQQELATRVQPEVHHRHNAGPPSKPFRSSNRLGDARARRHSKTSRRPLPAASKQGTSSKRRRR